MKGERGTQELPAASGKMLYKVYHAGCVLHTSEQLKPLESFLTGTREKATQEDERQVRS